MLRIDRQTNSLSRLSDPGMGNRGILERYNLQKMILNSANDFFRELGEDLKVIGEEVRPSDSVADRIDLLAVDEDGAAVIIEIKRGTDKLQLLQSLTYAAMIAKWDANRFAAELARGNGKNGATEEALSDFLGDAASSLNATQRIILLAEDFDFSVLVTADWLSEKLNLDVRCYRLTVSADGNKEFLSCSCIYPPAEIADQASHRKQMRERRKNRWSDWDTALSGIENKAVAAFFSDEVRAGRENKLGTRKLYFPIDGKRRYMVRARQLLANARQLGRFPGDIDFWQARLSDPVSVKAIKNGERLRFRLRSADDFRKFKEALANELPQKEFEQLPESGADEDDGETEE